MKKYEKNRSINIFFWNIDPLKVGISHEQLEKYKQIYIKTKECLKEEQQDTFEKFVEARIEDAYKESDTFRPVFASAVSNHFKTLDKIFDYNDWFIEAAVYDIDL